MGRNVKHTHLGKPVTYPSGMRPGDRIEWIEYAVGARYEPHTRTGVVIDRAANGVGDRGEAPGYWLWVVPDDDGPMVRVRTWGSGKRKGQVERDDGPMYVRRTPGLRPYAAVAG